MFQIALQILQAYSSIFYASEADDIIFPTPICASDLPHCDYIKSRNLNIDVEMRCRRQNFIVMLEGEM